MGYLRDIENMPNQYDYSLDFFRRYYRPEYTTIVVAGDIKHDNVLATGEEVLGRLAARHLCAEDSRRTRAERRAHGPGRLAAPTLPWIAVSYKGAGLLGQQKDKAALDLIGSLGFSQTSELYQRLVIKEQKVDLLGARH